LGERLVCIQKVAGSTPVRSTTSGMSDKLEEIITHAILQILLEARRQGKEMLSYEEIVTMLGMDDTSLLTKFEKDAMVVLNEDMLSQLDDPELLQAMVESLGETKH
jgi:hypothetical protein